jgi:hypothetical protein
VQTSVELWAKSSPLNVLQLATWRSALKRYKWTAVGRKGGRAGAPTPPNMGLQPTPASVRSYLAPAARRG